MDLSAALDAQVEPSTPNSRTDRHPPAAATPPQLSSAAITSRDATTDRVCPSSAAPTSSNSRDLWGDTDNLASSPASRTGSKRPLSPSPSRSDTAVPDTDVASQLELDEAFAKALSIAADGYETRNRAPLTMSDSPTPSSPPLATPPLAAPPKKRPPKNASKAKADGPPRKPPAKKRKADDGSERSATPASVAGKKKGGKKSLSATPMTGVSPEPKQEADDIADDESVEDEDAIYCICRKPDNHTWMIGCDGGCDDWYHGKCVNMRQEDEQLIDKFICPICAEKNDAVTTWKPMCRRDGCRNPARLKKGSESKYCSDQCGELFWKDMVHQAQQVSRGDNHRKPSKKSVKTESLGDSDADIGPLGGPITASELKALVNAAPDASTFRNLGEIGLPTPPESADVDAREQNDTPPIYEPYEQGRLEEIAAVKSRLYELRVVLRKRERFVMMTRDRATRLRQTNKDACGFDPLLAEDEPIFTEWLESAEGQAALDKGTLPDPAPKRDDEDEGDVDAKTVCLRRRCKKHGEWQKIALQDVRFDEAEVGDSMREIDAEETDLKRAGAMRSRARREGAVEHDGGTVEAVDEEMTGV